MKYGYSHNNIAIVEKYLQYSHENIAIYIASFGLWRFVGVLLEPLWEYFLCSFLWQCLHIWINVAQQSTEQHNTTEHRTAHSTAEHSKAQHSTTPE